jgi:hypothetical protein
MLKYATIIPWHLHEGAKTAEAADRGEKTMFTRRKYEAKGHRKGFEGKEGKAIKTKFEGNFLLFS